MAHLISLPAPLPLLYETWSETFEQNIYLPGSEISSHPLSDLSHHNPQHNQPCIWRGIRFWETLWSWHECPGLPLAVPLPFPCSDPCPEFLHPTLLSGVSRTPGAQSFNNTIAPLSPWVTERTQMGRWVPRRGALPQRRSQPGSQQSCWPRASRSELCRCPARA